MLKKLLIPVLCAAGLLLTSCAETPKPVPGKAQFTPVAFSDLPGWNADQSSEALPALARSCAVQKKTEWAALCMALSSLPPQDNQAARTFFENYFKAYAVSDKDSRDGLFTGYYEAELQGAMQPSGAYQTPLYARPDDLINVDLGDFKKDLHGQHIVGKIEGHALRPYDDRATVVRQGLKGRAQILVWVNDPVAAFFLAVQGSGRVQMADGSMLRVGYDGSNGRAYVAIGKAMADKGLIERPVTMQSIRSWLRAHPGRADEIMDLNPSYIFFKQMTGDGPVGAEGVALTPKRSLAVDPAFIKLGTPVWLDSVDGNGNTLQRLMVAQDTGGAIKGAVRGDVFWGAGPDAEGAAGAMQSPGHYYLLLPKNVPPDDTE